MRQIYIVVKGKGNILGNKTKNGNTKISNSRNNSKCGMQKYCSDLPNISPPNKKPFHHHSNRKRMESDRDKLKGIRLEKIDIREIDPSQIQTNNKFPPRDIAMETRGRSISQIIERDPATALAKFKYEVINVEDNILKINAIRQIGEIGTTGEKEFLKGIRQSFEKELESNENESREKINWMIFRINEAIKSIESRGF